MLTEFVTGLSDAVGGGVGDGVCERLISRRVVEPPILVKVSPEKLQELGAVLSHPFHR